MHSAAERVKRPGGTHRVTDDAVRAQDIRRAVPKAISRRQRVHRARSGESLLQLVLSYVWAIRRLTACFVYYSGPGR